MSKVTVTSFSDETLKEKFMKKVAQIVPTTQSKNLKMKIRDQIETYLSKNNIVNDNILISKMDSEKFIPISYIASLLKIQSLSKDINTIIYAIESSKMLELNELKNKVRAKYDNERTTLIIRDLNPSIKKKDVMSVLNGSNNIIRVYSEIGNNWFVDFKTEKDCLQAIEALQGKELKGEKIHCRVKSRSYSDNFHQDLSSGVYIPNNYPTGYEEIYYNEQLTDDNYKFYNNLPNIEVPDGIFNQKQVYAENANSNSKNIKYKRRYSNRPKFNKYGLAPQSAYYKEKQFDRRKSYQNNNNDHNELVFVSQSQNAVTNLHNPYIPAINKERVTMALKILSTRDYPLPRTMRRKSQLPITLDTPRKDINYGEVLPIIYPTLSKPINSSSNDEQGNKSIVSSSKSGSNKSYTSSKKSYGKDSTRKSGSSKSYTSSKESYGKESIGGRKY